MEQIKSIHSAARIARILLQDLVDDYFCNRDEVQDEWEIARLCIDYSRASEKAEIARDLLVEIDDAIGSSYD